MGRFLRLNPGSHVGASWDGKTSRALARGAGDSRVSGGT
jgi:hypothetical protein